MTSSLRVVPSDPFTGLPPGVGSTWSEWTRVISVPTSGKENPSRSKNAERSVFQSNWGDWPEPRAPSSDRGIERDCMTGSSILRMAVFGVSWGRGWTGSKVSAVRGGVDARKPGELAAMGWLSLVRGRASLRAGGRTGEEAAIGGFTAVRAFGLARDMAIRLASCSTACERVRLRPPLVLTLGVTASMREAGASDGVATRAFMVLGVSSTRSQRDGGRMSRFLFQYSPQAESQHGPQKQLTIAHSYRVAILHDLGAPHCALGPPTVPAFENVRIVLRCGSLGARC